ncbi:hypothetical protein [Lactococcus sp. SK2-659]|uniref:hypothetical protein n=1 Tax=Lactococcus sp. SK2-659 TaxID=2879150 RepID=UPI001CDB93B5|nr:hypothetical protein [Lactococcus sp. SK2-659]MCA2382416.1 hypothetical protein [Lactococcus sp. SK2-659]
MVRDSVFEFQTLQQNPLATRLYSETKNQALIANQLGHTDLNTSAIYISIVDDENRKGLDQL